MSVYFIRRIADPDGLIKIGFARNVRSRVSAISTACPGGVELLASMDGSAAVEHQIHDRLSGDRCDKEWFYPTDAVMKELEAARIAKETASVKLSRESVAHLVNAEDEFSSDIVVESRFYLNELVKREWAGCGDSPEEARIRLAMRLGLSGSIVRKLWYKFKSFKTVDGDTYRLLSNEYARTLVREGKAEARHIAVARFADYSDRRQTGEGLAVQAKKEQAR